MIPSPLLPLYLQNCKIYGHALVGHCPGLRGLYLLPYEVLSHLCRKCGHDGMNPEVRFRKSAKSRMPDYKSHDYKQQTLSSTTFWFSWAPGLSLLLAWFLDANIHCYLRPRKHVSLEIYIYLVLSEVITTSFRFRAWPWRHLSYLTSTCSTWCRFSLSPFVEFMDT